MEKLHKNVARFFGFVRSQDGAVTVDWVVLTAAVIGIGLAAAFSVGSNVPGLANQVSTVVANSEVTPQ